jgi:hypothetical protein
MVSILQAEDRILREKAKEVPLQEINSPKIKKILEDMKKALASQDDGVAIAAPQIGVSLRIFVISGKVLNFIIGDEENAPKHSDIIFIKYLKRKNSWKKGAFPSVGYMEKLNVQQKQVLKLMMKMEFFLKKGLQDLWRKYFNMKQII